MRLFTLIFLIGLLPLQSYAAVAPEKITPGLIHVFAVFDNDESGASMNVTTGFVFAPGHVLVSTNFLSDKAGVTSKRVVVWTGEGAFALDGPNTIEAEIRYTDPKFKLAVLDVAGIERPAPLLNVAAYMPRQPVSAFSFPSRPSREPLIAAGEFSSYVTVGDIKVVSHTAVFEGEPGEGVLVNGCNDVIGFNYRRIPMAMLAIDSIHIRDLLERAGMEPIFKNVVCDAPLKAGAAEGEDLSKLDSKTTDDDLELSQVLPEEDAGAMANSTTSSATKGGQPVGSDSQRGDVMAAQLLLKDLGYDPGAVDGVVGAKTAESIARFQSDNGLTVDGQVSSAVMRALRTAASSAAEAGEQETDDRQEIQPPIVEDETISESAASSDSIDESVIAEIAEADELGPSQDRGEVEKEVNGAETDADVEVAASESSISAFFSGDRWVPVVTLSIAVVILVFLATLLVLKMRKSRAAASATDVQRASQLLRTAGVAAISSPVTRWIIQGPGVRLRLDRSTLISARNGLTIGRDPGESGLGIEDSSISRTHARFLLRGDDLYIEDLGSANGTYVNGRELAPNSPQAVSPNDQITFGEIVVRITAV